MLSWQETIIRLVVAAFLGGLVGIERERLDWAAGLRTHMMVCLGSALVMIVSAFGFKDVIGTPGVALDPSRVAAQVISGIGFLGAGTILFLKHEVVKGLTTAAGLWTVAGIGLAVGGGLYFAAIATTVLALIILVVIKPYKNKIYPHKQQNEINLFIRNKELNLQIIQEIIQEHQLNYSDISIHHSDKADAEHINIKFGRKVNQPAFFKVIDALKKLTGVQVVMGRMRDAGKVPAAN